MDNEDDQDLKLVKASATLLSDLEQHLPRLLWKPSRRAHTRVRQRHIDTIVNLIEPFQSDPQLLDAKLNIIVPNIASAYLDFLQRDASTPESGNESLESAVCTLLYTLCKVRGQKVIVGLLNNEPKHLEKILSALERTLAPSKTQTPWQVPYSLLLWLSHLLLTPFDLASISSKPVPDAESVSLSKDLPPLAARALRVGLAYLPSSTKAQEAAATMVVKLAVRPDVVHLGLADFLVAEHLQMLNQGDADFGSMYVLLGSLRLISGMSGATELGHLLPTVYRACKNLFDRDDVPIDGQALTENAVAKKLAAKTFRNIAILSMRAAALGDALCEFLQETDALENIIDYLIRSLGDKDTPVRYAGAKAISLIVLELDPEMSHEIIQAILDSFKEDIPRSAAGLDFTTADPLRWHGLTLALAHTLFKRSASPQQLPDILDALMAALQFQQRSATGNSLGTNVRDAANFGIWSLARRYTTDELLSVQANSLHRGNTTDRAYSIIQVLATQLLLSACLDPEGNIRRGSSAALQEVVGRHPDQVPEGISLVQIVDYQAVSLRSRAIIKVADSAAALDKSYWEALRVAFLGWRGLKSSSTDIREDASIAIATLSKAIKPTDGGVDALEEILQLTKNCPEQDVELLHGYTLTMTTILDYDRYSYSGRRYLKKNLSSVLGIFETLHRPVKDFTARVLRSQYPAALARLLGTLLSKLKAWQDAEVDFDPSPLPLSTVDSITERLLSRHEDWLLPHVPELVRGLFWLKRTLKVPLGHIGAQSLSQTVMRGSTKSTPNGTGRAIALGALASHYDTLEMPPAAPAHPKARAAIEALASLVTSMTVDWRVTGAQALNHVVCDLQKLAHFDSQLLQPICDAIVTGLNDYTIDQRGDVGSLVRLRCLDCADMLLQVARNEPDMVMSVKANIHRLSLEKLDRVRLRASSLSALTWDYDTGLTIAHMDRPDIAHVSSQAYLRNVLEPLLREGASDTLHPTFASALVEGLVSCAGVANETLLQAARIVLTQALYTRQGDVKWNEFILKVLNTVMIDQLSKSANLHPALELLAFLLDMQIQSTVSTNFRWRPLLSTVQKAHHKSGDIPRILAAVHCYIGLADVASIRAETIKKLISMLRTNPYFRVRAAVAEALFVVTDDEDLKQLDCSQKLASNQGEALLQKYIISGSGVQVFAATSNLF